MVKVVQYEILDYGNIIKELENDECMFFGELDEKRELEDYRIIKLVYKRVRDGFNDKKIIEYYEILNHIIFFKNGKAFFEAKEIEDDLLNNEKQMKIDKGDILNRYSKYVMFEYKL